MAGNTALLVIKILADAKDAIKGIDSTASAADKFKGGIDKLTGPALGVVGAIGLIGKQAIDSASELQQSMGGIDAVFGTAADAAKGFAAASAETVGLAESEYANLATVIGAQLKNAGTPIDELAGKTDGLITTGADLAATFGGSTSDAVGALSSALKGEMDPIEKYGITLNAAAIEAKRAEQGTSDLTGAADTAAKQQAILALITEQSADAQGQFGEEIDTVAGQQQVANAKFEDAKAALGTALLPAVTTVTSAFGEMAGIVSENSAVFLAIGGVIAGLAAAILITNVAIKAYSAITKIVSAATKVWTAIQWLLNTAFLSSPITWIVLAIIALIAVIVIIATKTTWFQDIWEAVWGAVVSVASAAWEWVSNAASAALDFIVGLWNGLVDAVQAVWNWIKSAIETVLNVIQSIIVGYINIYINIWNGIKSAVQAVWNWIRNIIDSVLGIVKGIIQGYINIYISIWEGIKSAVGAVFDWLKDKAETVLKIILKPVHAVEDAFNAVVDAIRSVIDWLGNIKMPAPLQKIADTIGNLNPFSMTAPGVPTAVPTVAPALTATASSSRGSSGPTIVIEGAIDPVAVARQVRLILRSDERRRSGVVIA
jgi:hypothetical protein